MPETLTSGPIKSVHLTNYYHKNSGGISTSYNNLLAAALRHRRYISLIVPGEKEEIEQVNEFARIYYIPAPKSPIFDKRYRMIMPWQYMKGGTRIRDILLAEMPDMVEVCDKYSLSFMGAMIRTNNFKKLGRPMLVHFSCERMDDNVASFLSKGRFGKWFSRRVMGNYEFALYDFHIANSVYTAEEFYRSVEKADNPRRSDAFLNWCWRFFRAAKVDYKERIFVCPRGVDAGQFDPHHRSEDVRREMRERAGLSENAVMLLYAGRISPEKNIELLPELMDALKNESRDYRLLVAGAGPQAEWLRAQTEKRFPGKIIQLGHLDKETLANYYASADIFLHPNPREPFGIAPLEAMASGVPVVAPNAGGLLSYATQENAWLVETNGESFAAAIKEVTENDELRARKIAAALETARANTRERSTDFLLETYDRMYEDFQRRKELFAYKEKSDFDFAEMLKQKPDR
jgi:glycosyltransferase involved in cell wall biosynthesis